MWFCFLLLFMILAADFVDNTLKLLKAVGR